MPPQEHEVIDLTDDVGEESLTIEHVQQRAPTEIFTSNDEEDILIVHSRPASRRALKRRRLQRQGVNKAGRTGSQDSNEPQIVNSRPITVQERFARIQEMHRRGETVRNGPGLDHNDDAELTFLREASSPSIPFRGLDGNIFTRPAIQSLFRGSFLFMSRFLDPDSAASPDAVGLGSEGSTPPGTESGPMAMSTLEQRIFEQTLQRSLSDMSRRRSVDPRTIVLPKDIPEKAAPGYTLSLEPPKVDGEPQLLVCATCNNELGVGRPEAPMSQRVFVRGCGHAYCGSCVVDIKDKVQKKRACPVADCKSIRSRTKNQFREVYM